MLSLLLLLAVQDRLPPANPVPYSDPEVANVMAPVDAMLRAIAARDGAALLQQVRPDGGATVAVEGADEHVLHLLRVGGRVRYRLCYRYDMADPLAVRGREATPRLIEPADPAPALGPCEAILDALGYEGTCCFNYKLEGGRPMILELNPRFGGSLVGDVTAYLAAHLDAL